jgi:hypothetical protein
MKRSESKNANEITPDSEAFSELSAKQELALRALISHPTMKEAALAAGIGETTLWRYQQDESFARRLREARREVFSHATLRLQHACGDAVKALSEIVNNPEAGAGARVTAARVVLDQSLRAIEQDDLRARLDEMERFILRKQEEEALDRASKKGSEEE